MGLGQSIGLQTQPWVEEDWQPLQRQVINFAKTRTLQSVKNGALADEYQLIWQTQTEYEFYLKSFNWRSKRKNHSPIVGSIGLKPIIGGGMCSTKMIANVYLEHIGVRLSQIDEIPLSYSLYIILTALQGYQELYNHSGYFRVQEQQICIDRIGKVKVWVNKDLSKNYPEVDAESEGLRRNEVHMVRQIVDIVEENTDKDQMLQPSLSEYLTQIKRKEGKEIGFEYAQVAVLEYAKLNNIVIPNRLDAATEIYQTDLPLSPTLTYCQPKQVNQKAETATSIELQQKNQQLLISHQSMPNLRNSGQCNFQYVNPPKIAHTNFDFVRSNPPSQIQNPQSNLMNTQTSSHVPENYIHNSFDQFAPQQSVHSIQKQSEYVQMNPSEVQLPSTTKRTAQTQSHLACLEQASAQSIRVDQRDQRNTMKSMPLREPFSSMRERKGNYQVIRYSQCLQEDRNNHFNTIKINHDCFGLTNQQRRFMKQSSNSSYKIGSSNSSRRSKWKGQSRRGSSPSRRESNSRRQSFLSVREELVEGRKYFMSLGQYGFLDPQIQADMLRYLN